MSAKTTLQDLVDDAPLVICLGPGGVGKTTVSAVLALRTAVAGRRSLVLTIDPARRLADALGVAGLTNDPTPVTAFDKMHQQGSLSALMLDPAVTFDHLISMLVPDADRRRGLLENRFYVHLSRSLSGTLEYMAIERLHDLSNSGAFDSIVLDTPPTTNALDFLEAPDRAARFFHEKVLRWFMPTTPNSGWTARLFDRAGSRVLGLMARLAGEQFVEDMTGFFSAFGDLFGAFRARGERIGALLRDPRSVFIVVTSPDPSRIDEAREIDRRLSEAGCAPRAFIVNRVDQAYAPEWLDLDASTTRAAALIGESEDRVRAFVERLESHRQSFHETVSLHGRALEELRAYAGARPVFSAPRVPQSGSARESLLGIYLGLFSP
ncbi:MAG: ArsA-related P-loop ATPase [Pseudomonadota bacterium]